MNREFPLLSPTGSQGCSGVWTAGSQRPFCGLLVLLVVSGCGGGDGGGTAPPPKPLSVTEQTLYSFGGISAADAMGPSGVLIQGSDGNFYGTTYNGGIDGGGNGPALSAGGYSGNGTVYKITPTGEE